MRQLPCLGRETGKKGPGGSRRDLLFQRSHIPVLALPVPGPGWGRCSHFRSWGYVVSQSLLLPKSENRENSLEGCYGNQSPWRAQCSTNPLLPGMLGLGEEIH